MSEPRNSGGTEHVAAYRKELLGRADHQHSQQLWLKKRVFDTYSRLLEEFVGRSLDATDNILDTGSAGGAFAEVCRQNGIACAELDINMEVNFEADAFPFPDATFSITNSSAVIEHLHDPSCYLREIHRTLKSGGYLILTTPHWPYAAKDFYDSYTHYRPYSYKSMASLVTAYGFEPIALVPWLVEKSRLFWRLPSPFSFWVAANLLFLPGTTRWAPGFLKGRSQSLLLLARKNGAYQAL